jgi:hypothetical protein
MTTHKVGDIRRAPKPSDQSRVHCPKTTINRAVTAYGTETLAWEASPMGENGLTTSRDVS